MIRWFSSTRRVLIAFLTLVAVGSLAVSAMGCCGAGSVPATLYLTRPEQSRPRGEWDRIRQDVLPYRWYLRLIGVEPVVPERRAALLALFDSLGLEDVTECNHPTQPSGMASGFFILQRRDGGNFDRTNDSTLRALRRVVSAGPLVELPESRTLAILSNAISVKSSSGFPRDTGTVLGRELAGCVSTSIGGDPYILALDSGIGEGVNDVVRRLLEARLIEWGEVVWNSMSLPDVGPR